jgi:rhodanese-related sulfurtransferase
MSSIVTETQAASPEVALAHFERRLSLETDCWDVHEVLANGNPDFVLLDVRSPALFAAGHVAGAINLPYRRINEQTLAAYPKDRLLVVYCAGPHCNAANKVAVRIAALGRPVKEMIGGIAGWCDEGFELATG